MGQTWLQKYLTYEEEVTGELTAITAFAGGGQGSATALTYKYNSVDTCATNEDSVKLPAALTGKKITVFNNTAKILSIYPISGDYINNTVNLKFNCHAGWVQIFECVRDGYWESKLIQYKLYDVLLTQTSTNAPVETILENTIGATPAWSYIGVGRFDITQAGIFLAGKTFKIIESVCVGGAGAGAGDMRDSVIQRVDDNSLRVITTQSGSGYANDILTSTSLIIK